MALVNERGGWWGLQCPARPKGLAHAHESGCDAPAHRGRCCECGVGPNDRPAAAPVPPPINVNDRLRALGLMPQPSPPTLTADEVARLEVNVLHMIRKRGYR